MLQKDFTQILIRSKRKQVNNSQICYLKISKRLMIKTGNPVQSYKKKPTNDYCKLDFRNI